MFNHSKKKGRNSLQLGLMSVHLHFLSFIFSLILASLLCYVPILLQEIDLRIGASFTRFQTMLLRDAFVLDFAADGRNVVLSYGPCQVYIRKLNYMLTYISDEIHV